MVVGSNKFEITNNKMASEKTTFLEGEKLSLWNVTVVTSKAILWKDKKQNTSY